MADRTSVCLTLGGDLLNIQQDARADLIIAHGLSVEWNGPLFDVTHLAVDAPLTLYAHEVAWGRLEATGLAHRPSAPGEIVSGQYRERVTLASGRFARRWPMPSSRALARQVLPSSGYCY